MHSVCAFVVVDEAYVKIEALEGENATLKALCKEGACPSECANASEKLKPKTEKEAWVEKQVRAFQKQIKRTADKRFSDGNGAAEPDAETPASPPPTQKRWRRARLSPMVKSSRTDKSEGDKGLTIE